MIRRLRAVVFLPVRVAATLTAQRLPYTVALATHRAFTP